MKTIDKSPLYSENYSYLSLFDEQFSILDFRNTVKDVEETSDSLIDSAKVVVRKACEKNNEGPNYVVDMDADLKSAINSGEIKLVTSKQGEVFAQIRDSSGRFGKSLPIKKELANEGISTEALQIALQMEVIKDQLIKIVDGLREIESKVTDIIRGQRNDRIGLFYSGLNLYLESRVVKDEFLKKQIVAQSLKSISDANSQMIQDIRAIIEYLVNKEYNKSVHIKKDIEEHISILYQCYDVVYRSTFLKAMIYQENLEIFAMLTLMDEYGRFIEKMIVPYVGILSELDQSNKFIDKGKWGMIAKTLTGCRELRHMILESNTFYLNNKEVKSGS